MGLPSLYDIGARIKRPIGIFNDRSETQAYGLLARISPAGLGEPPALGDLEMLRAYYRLPWFRAVLNRIGHSVATTTWEFYSIRQGGRVQPTRHIQRMPKWEDRRQKLKELKAAGELVQITEHPGLEVLHNPNGFLTGIQTWKLTEIFYETIGETFLLKERNAAAVLCGLWPIPPYWIRQTPTPEKRFYTVGWRGFQQTIPETEVIWFTDPNPENPYGRGRGTGQALADDLEMDQFAAKYAKAWFYNGARPDIVITADGLGKPETKVLEENWLNKSQGFWRAFKPMFLNRKVDIHELNTDFASNSVIELRKFERDLLMQVWGMPPELLGVIESSNRATIEAADYLWSRYGLVPRLESQRELLQERFIPEYDDRILIDYVSPVKEDDDFKLKVMQGQPAAFMIDDWRDFAGRGPLGKMGEGATLLVPALVTPMDPSELPTATGGSEPTKPTDGGKALDWHQRYLQAKEADRKPGDGYPVDALLRLADRLEPGVQRRFLKAVAQLMDSADWDALEQAVLNGSLPDAERALALNVLAEGLSNLHRDLHAAALGGGTIAAEFLLSLGSKVNTSALSAKAQQWARTRAGEQITLISDATRDTIREILERAYRDNTGVIPRDVAAEIRQVIGLDRQRAATLANHRAELQHQGVSGAALEHQVSQRRNELLSDRAMSVARTEIMGANNRGQEMLWADAVKQGLLNPDKTRREFIATEDSATCEICTSLDGTKVPLDEPFDPAYGDPPIHVRCRCTEGLVFS